MNVTRKISHFLQINIIDSSIHYKTYMERSKRSQIKSERQTFFALGDCMLQLSPHDFTATAYGHTISSVNTFART